MALLSSRIFHAYTPEALPNQILLRRTDPDIPILKQAKAEYAK